MKALLPFKRILAVSLVVLGCSQPARAQQAPVSRADIAGTVGWLAINREAAPAFAYSDEWQNSLFIAATGGWYWTDHIKTELEFGGGTDVTAFRSRRIVIDGRPISEFVESRYARRTLALGQHYQFFRNAWFHPYAGAGLNITFEDITDRRSAIVIYHDPPRGPQVLRPEVVDGPRRDVMASVFFATGFKAYFTQRGFFRSDLKVSVRNGVDETLLRLGFGVDF